MVVGCVAGEVQVVRPMAPPNRAARLPHPWVQVQSQLQPRHITVSLWNQWDPGSDSGQQGPLCSIWRAYRMESILYRIGLSHLGPFF